MLFLVARALGRALTVRITREDIFNRRSRERRGCFAMRDIDVQFTAGFGPLRSPRQRIPASINLRSAKKGVDVRCRAAREIRKWPSAWYRASYSRFRFDDDDDDDDDGNGDDAAVPLINPATERLPLFTRRKSSRLIVARERRIARVTTTLR